MRPTVEADGEKWEVRAAEGGDAHAGTRAIIFSCLTNNQEPYRVVEVDDSRGDDAALERMDTGRLEELFARSSVMGGDRTGAAVERLRELPPG